MPYLRRFYAAVVLGCLSLTLFGCNQFEKHFTSELAVKHPPVNEYANYNVKAFGGQVTVLKCAVGDTEKQRKLYEDGYELLGKSYFLDTAEKRFGLEGFAKGIKAEIVTITEDYHSTQTQTKRIEKEIPETIYNVRYVATENGRIKQAEEITTYKKVAEYVPYDVNYYQYDVSYWAKLISPPILGAKCVELSSKEMQNRNILYGIKVFACYRGGPAWDAGLMVGDLILKLDSYEIGSVAQLERLLERNAGQEIELTIYKNGEKRIKKIWLNADPRFKYDVY